MDNQVQSDTQTLEDILNLFSKLGLPTEAIEQGYQALLGTSVAFMASSAHDKLVEIAPQAIAMFEYSATKGRESGQMYLSLAKALEELDRMDKPQAEQICQMLNFKFQPAQALSPSEWAIFFYMVGRGLTELAEIAAKLLDEFNNRKPNLLAALVLLPRLSEFKPHEFMYSLPMNEERVDFSNPVDYVATVFVALCLNRQDIITKAVHFRLASEVASGLISQRYVELGGEQWIMEKTAQDYLDNKTQSITEASLLDGGAVHQAERVVAKLGPLVNEFQKKAIEELKKAKQADDLSKPKSLNTEIEDEDGKITTLVEMLPASPDLDEAMPQLLEIWEKFDPENAELLTERFFEGKSVNEIAIERHWNYDKTQKRIERLVKEVLEKMAD